MFFEGMSPLFSNKDYMAALSCGCPSCEDEMENLCAQFEHMCWLEAKKTTQEYSMHRWAVKVRKTKVERILLLTEDGRWFFDGKPVTEQKAQGLVARAYEDGIGVVSRAPRPVVVKA